MNRTEVHGTFREMWETRPARPRDDRQIAGVAAAIARRYDIDPVLVRVGFVVAAFFGIGAALYIAGWIVLPDAPADPAVPESRKRGILVVGLVVATIVSVGSISHGHGGFLFPLLAVLALLFLLHRSRADRGLAGTGRPAGLAGAGATRSDPSAHAQSSGVHPQSWPPQAGATSAQDRVSLVKDADAADTPPPPEDPKPPSWDPLGAAPFAWDLPEPSPVAGPAPVRAPPPAGHARDAGPGAARGGRHERGAAADRFAGAADRPGAAGCGARRARRAGCSSGRSCTRAGGSSRSRCCCRP